MSDVTGRAKLDADVDGSLEHVGNFTVWFNDFTRFDQQLHLLIDLNVFTDGDEQLLLLLKVSCVQVLLLLLLQMSRFKWRRHNRCGDTLQDLQIECYMTLVSMTVYYQSAGNGARFLSAKWLSDKIRFSLSSKYQYWGGSFCHRLICLLPVVLVVTNLSTNAYIRELAGAPN